MNFLKSSSQSSYCHLQQYIYTTPFASSKSIVLYDTLYIYSKRHTQSIFIQLNSNYEAAIFFNDNLNMDCNNEYYAFPTVVIQLWVYV